MTWFRRSARLLTALIAMAMLLSACTGYVARQVVKPPNQGGAQVELINNMEEVRKALLESDIANEFSARLDDGTSIAYSVIAPERTTAIVDVRETADATRFNLKLQFLPGPYRAPRGTIVVLHGYSLDGLSMVPWGAYLSGSGYRVLLPDLPGHGRSSPNQVTFGAREVPQLLEWLQQMQASDMIEPPVAVLGLSLGGSIALKMARASADIQAVVAIAPFDEPRGAVVRAAKKLSPVMMSMLSDASFARSLDRAEQVGGFDWENLRTSTQVAGLATPTMIIVGEDDEIAPPEGARAIMSRLSGPGRLETFPGHSHLSLPIRVDLLGQPVVDFLDQYLHPSTTRPPSETTNVRQQDQTDSPGR